MARGAIVSSMAGRGSSSHTNINPSSAEWVIRTIGWNSTGSNAEKVNIYRVDAGSTIAKIAMDGDGTPELYYNYHTLSVTLLCSSTHYYRVKNVSGSSAYIWWEGRQIST